MFYQSMTYTGFFAVWFLYNVLFVIYLIDVKNHSKRSARVNNVGSFIVRIYLIALSNLFMAASLVVLPVFALITDIHVYWIVIGIIYTLIVHIFYIEMYVEAEVMIREFKGKKMDEKKENNNLKVLSYLLIVGIVIYYLLVVFNFFEVFPVLDKVLPPIMPLYYHMIVDFLILLKLFLLNILLFYVYKYRIKSMRVEE